MPRGRKKAAKDEKEAAPPAAKPNRVTKAAPVSKTSTARKTPANTAAKSTKSTNTASGDKLGNEITSISSDYDYDDDDDSCDYEDDNSCDYDPYSMHFNSQRMLSDYHRGCAYDEDASDFEDYSNDRSFDDSEDYEEGMDDFLFRDNVSVVESYLRGYSQRPNINFAARARISDFILFLHTLPFAQISGAFSLFRSEFDDMDPFERFNWPHEQREGMSEAEIGRLPRHAYRGQTQKEKRLNEDPHKCCICMAELEFSEELILLEKCSHRFHSGCLESWLKRSNKCPMCRATVNPPPLIIN